MLALCLCTLVLSQDAAPELVAPPMAQELPAPELSAPPAPPEPMLLPQTVATTATVSSPMPAARDPHWRLALGLGETRSHSRSARWLSATEAFSLGFSASRRTPMVLSNSALVAAVAMLSPAESRLGDAALALHVYELGVGMALDVPQAAVVGDWLMPYARILARLSLFDVSAGSQSDLAVSAALSAAAGLRAELGRRRLWHLFVEGGYVARLPRALELSPDEADDDASKPLTTANVPLGTLHLSGIEMQAGIGLSF